MSLHCCKLRSVVVSMLSYQPFIPEFDSWMGSACVMQYAGTGKEMHEALFFLLQAFFFCFASKPRITVRVGAGMPA